MKLVILSEYDFSRAKGDPQRRWAPVDVDDALGAQLLAHGAAKKPEDYPVDERTGALLPGRSLPSPATSTLAETSDPAAPETTEPPAPHTTAPPAPETATTRTAKRKG